MTTSGPSDAGERAGNDAATPSKESHEGNEKMGNMMKAGWFHVAKTMP